MTTLVKEAVELKPCPFCEGPVYKHSMGDVEGCVHIGMPHCPVESHRVMTVEQWNTRASLPTDDDDTVERMAINQLCAKVEADAVAGLRYIEKHYGRLDGVGWDRVFDAHDELFRRGAAIHTLIGRDR